MANPGHTQRTLRAGGGLAVMMTAAGLAAGAASSADTTAPAARHAHAFTFERIDGGPLPLEQFAGKAILVVNTASRCGFTPQYDGLQALWEQYRDRGLVVLGVPSNDFGAQEPGSNSEIQEFCTLNFNITFPMTAKAKVTGSDAHPFYRWARQRAGLLGGPKWNFHKYLIAPDGTFAGSFSSVTGPSAGRLTAAIERVLPKRPD
jgi:glutathione peroxidase